jgi:DinB superfamily
MPSAAQYQEKLQAYTEGKDPLAMQADAPRIVAELIAAIPEARLRERPSPGKWSVVEIIAHLAEDELSSSWRYRQMIENSGCALAGFDQDEWARLGNYRSWKPAEALEMFRLLREANLRLLHGLSADEWERYGVHAERGRITVRDLARHMAGHDMNHVDQIRAILNKAD